MTPNPLVCACCGAPDDGQEVTCKFCQRPVSPQVQASAIPCPQCQHVNRWGRQQCSRCNGWIVVQCVFCGSISPCSYTACMRCNEAFAGAWQRKQQREAQEQTKEITDVLGSVGAIAGAMIIGGRRW
jgi:hypothetical protein